VNDIELIAGLRRRESGAVSYLMDCYVTSLWRGVYVRTHGDSHLAEDITSETVLAVFRTLSDPESEVHNLMAWMRAVADHKLHDYFRAAARVQHLLEAAGPQLAKEDLTEPSHAQELDERRAAIRKVMDGLAEPHRLILEWKYLDRLSVREIALRLQVSEKAAESILFRARREFRSSLGPGDEDDADPVTLPPRRAAAVVRPADASLATPDETTESPVLISNLNSPDHPPQVKQRR